MKWTGLGSAWAVMVGVLVFPSFSQAQDCTPQTFDGAWNGEVTLCQNWDAEQQQEFWFLSQGSLIIPYDWFLFLEQKGSEVPFRDGAHMDGFRYLPQRPTAANPDALPIGFTRDDARGHEGYEEMSDHWLGLTCAACHTGQIEYRGHKMLIDGAPTMADFEGFQVALVEAIKATRDDDVKFDRFATKVLTAGGAAARSKAELKEQLEAMIQRRDAWNQRNAGDHPYGFARLDAIGAIFNEITVTAIGIPGNRRSANAPVSYPFIWDTPQHDRVQWNGSVENAGPGALGRNVGEVLGVFGALTLDTHILSRRGHKTSVDVKHLGRLEELVWTLWSPLWRETNLPTIDDALAGGKGRRAFEKHCIRCHADIERTDPDRLIMASMWPVGKLGTDPAMAKNFATRTSNSGGFKDGLKGRFKKYWGIVSRFETYGDEGANAEFLLYGVIGTITRALFRDPIGTVGAIKAGQPSAVVRILEDAEGILARPARKKSIRRFLKQVAEKLRQLKKLKKADEKECAVCYKGRPLNGIWATAPYLHNGSVRTMRQLLLPTGMRQDTFHVGSREYDPVDMGFKDEGGFELDTNLDGNKNTGHEGPEYGNEEFLNDPDMLDALLEYLKTL